MVNFEEHEGTSAGGGGITIKMSNRSFICFGTSKHTRFDSAQVMPLMTATLDTSEYIRINKQKRREKHACRWVRMAKLRDRKWTTESLSIAVGGFAAGSIH